MGQTSAKISPQNQEQAVRFEGGLQAWVQAAAEDERAGREEARQRILECKRTNSTSLDLNVLKLSSLPNVIGYLTQLRILGLSFNELRQLPSSIGNLKKLQELNLNSNRLEQIPESIGNITRLERLDVSYNKLNQIPDAIGSLVELKTLNLTHNQIRQIPDTISNLNKLEKLYLRVNQLKAIPESVGKLPRLKELNLYENQLTTVPQSFFRSRQARLTLRVGYNQIRPEEAQRLTELATNVPIVLDITVQNLFGQDIVDQIAKQLPQAESFLQQPELVIFRWFLEECSKTKGWQKNNAEMLGNFVSLVGEMESNSNLKDKCLAIAKEAFSRQQDFVASSYAQMLVAQNIEQRPIAEMNFEQLAEAVKKNRW